MINKIDKTNFGIAGSQNTDEIIVDKINEIIDALSNKLSLKIKLTKPNSKMPTKAHEHDACFDLYAAVDKPIEINQHSASPMFSLGISTEIPDGYFCAIFPRSGLGIKQNLRLSNSTGIIDSNYRGEWMTSIYNDSDDVRRIEPGQRVCQFAVLPMIESELELVEELSESERGACGFGSTDIK